MAFTYITVTGTWTNSDQSPSSGRVAVVPSAPFANDGIIISADPVMIDLVGGRVHFDLAATDDVDTFPTGITYTIFSQIIGQRITTVQTTLPNDLVNHTIDFSQFPAPATGGGGGIFSGASSVKITNVPVGMGEILVSTSPTTATWEYQLSTFYIIEYSQGAYEPRPPGILVPAGNAFYKGPIQPTDNLVGDLWLFT